MNNQYEFFFLMALITFGVAFLTILLLPFFRSLNDNLKVLVPSLCLSFDKSPEISNSNSRGPKSSEERKFKKDVLGLKKDPDCDETFERQRMELQVMNWPKKLHVKKSWS